MYCTVADDADLSNKMCDYSLYVDLMFFFGLLRPFGLFGKQKPHYARSTNIGNIVGVFIAA